ncbi:MAG: hypothetical protein A2Z25_05005 [Planctomycetes bacterium RBG_16_55_9]|nr:MAG: hypothetical protein A2Z25_05005 [Planctomycetes bacterium RBG_16_55_9]
MMGFFARIFRSRGEPAEDYYNQGTAYAEEAQYDRAIYYLTKAIELNPSYAAAYNNRGFAYAELHEYEKAISDLTKVIEISPNEAAAYYGRGQAYYNKGQYDQAISEFTMALEINPEDAQAYYNRGVAYYKKRHYDQAISDYNKALEVDPTYGKAYCNRAVAYLNKGEYDKAREDVRKAILLGEIVPSDLLAHLRETSEIGSVLSKRLKESIESIPRSLSLSDLHQFFNLDDINKVKLTRELTILTFVAQRLAIQLMHKPGSESDETKRREICGALDKYASEFLESSSEFHDLLDKRGEQYFELLQSHNEQISSGQWDEFIKALQFKFEQFCRGGEDEKQCIMIGSATSMMALWTLAALYWSEGFTNTVKYIDERRY